MEHLKEDLIFAFIGKALFCDSLNITRRISSPEGASVSLNVKWPKMDPNMLQDTPKVIKSS